MWRCWSFMLLFAKRLKWPWRVWDLNARKSTFSSCARIGSANVPTHELYWRVKSTFIANCGKLFRLFIARFIRRSNFALSHGSCLYLNIARIAQQKHSEALAGLYIEIGNFLDHVFPVAQLQCEGTGGSRFGRNAALAHRFEPLRVTGFGAF